MQKLELTWIGKGNEPAIEQRILLHDASKDYGDPAAQNMLIHGDNLLALKALEQEYTGQVKCIYIDPPYNIDAAQDVYDDNIEHSTWLSLMKRRLELLWSITCHSPTHEAVSPRSLYLPHAAAESISENRYDARTDIYQLGLTAFRLINGISTVKEKFDKDYEAFR